LGLKGLVEQRLGKLGVSHFLVQRCKITHRYQSVHIFISIYLTAHSENLLEQWQGSRVVARTFLQGSREAIGCVQTLPIMRWLCSM
jgi:hypothetical protein